MPNFTKDGELQVCCDECNQDLVIPARLLNYRVMVTLQKRNAPRKA